MGTLFAGAARVDVTPAPGKPLAGYGPGGKLGRGTGAPLHARVLWLEGQAGPAVIAVLDLLGGGGALLAAVAERTRALGLSRERIILIGTHTHNGPGGYFGSTLYDTLAAARPGFDAALTAGLADGTAQAILQAQARAEPARLRFGARPLWGPARAADLAAFAANPEAARWQDPGEPGEAAPAELELRRRAVDPRLRALVVERPSGAALAVFAWFSLHPTALGDGAARYDPDWPGHAAALAEAALPGAVVALASGSGADVNALDPHLAQGPELVAGTGAAVAQALLALVPAAAPLEGLPRIRAGAIRLAEPRVNGDAATELAPWCFGVTALAGGDDARSSFFRLGLVPAERPGASFPPDHPQHPKRRALGLVQRALAPRLALAPELPLHLLTLGPLAIATVPGEPTVCLARRLERRLGERLGGQVLVAGYAGDYAGYFTTPEEYARQGYEGASTLLGRNSARHLEARLLELAGGGDGEPPPGG